MTLHPDILVQAEAWHEALPEAEAWVKHLCGMVFLLSGVGRNLAEETIEVSVVLADDTFIETLNSAYRGKQKPTNVLSFPALDLTPGGVIPIGNIPEITLGDVIIALETVQREAEEQHKPLKSHVAHMVVHGMLHLLGYDHIKEEEAEVMEALEVAILREADIDNPYDIKHDIGTTHEP